MNNSKEAKINIIDGDAFFADEISVSHNPLKFVIDFKNITPRHDMRSASYQPLVLKHTVIMMDVHTAKNLLSSLSMNIDKYEKQFGKIERPKVLDKIPKSMKSKFKPDEVPIYFG